MLRRHDCFITFKRSRFSLSLSLSLSRFVCRSFVRAALLVECVRAANRIFDARNSEIPNQIKRILDDISKMTINHTSVKNNKRTRDEMNKPKSENTNINKTGVIVDVLFINTTISLP